MTTTNTLHAVNTIAVIRPLTGEFADSRLELAFRNSTWEQVVRQQRSSLLILAVLVLAFALPDFVAMEAGPALWLLATYRALFALALLVGIEALRRAPELGLHGHLLMWLALLGYPFLFLFCALRPELRMFNIATVMVMQIGVFLFWPIRLLLALPVVLLGATGETLCIGWFSADLNDTLATGFSVCMPAVLGYFFALRLQTTARQQFWLSQQLQFVNHELSGEIARRVALQEELEHQATTDMLTGLPNRRAFLARFSAELARVQRSGDALSLAMLDLDHFKQVNDRYGHAAGDAVLRSVGQLCTHSFRGEDMAARVGGEEFLVLLPGCRLEQAAAVMERFVSTLAETDIDFGTQTLRVTATAGVVQQQASASLDALLASADAALYAGKQAGRNRVVLAPALVAG